MCIGCRNRKKKQEMIRLVRTPDGLAPADGKNGSARGFYLCPDSECLKKAEKKNPMGRVLAIGEARTSLGKAPI